MCHNDTTESCGPFEDLCVRPTRESFLERRANIGPSGSQAIDHLWTDVLVGEERKLERLHAVIFNSQFCSVLSACAAY